MLRCGDSLWAAAVRISEEEGAFSLMPSSSFPVGAAAKRISEEEDDMCSSVFSSFNVAVGGRLEQLNLNTEAQSVCSRCEVSGVIIFRLELVIIPRWFLSEVVVRAVCTLTTTSMLVLWCGLRGCVSVIVRTFLITSSCSR